MQTSLVQNNDLADPQMPKPEKENDAPMSTGRRQKLPVPMPETEGINLWNVCSEIH